VESGDRVRWRWGAGEGEGVVREVRRERMEREIDGSTIARNGTDENPACLIEQESGQLVLKLSSELRRA
jgi:hypothetical protein